MQRARQMSDSMFLACVLSLAGGLTGAYSYLCRGRVFANAQTGNILLMGVNLSTRDFAAALRYACPVAAFALGIAGAELLRERVAGRPRVHWRQVAVLLEALILLVVAFLPQRVNILANGLTSLVCGMQVQCFRKVEGHAIATTMCIGNLRAATESLCTWRRTGSALALRAGLIYLGLILSFAVGAVVGNALVEAFQEGAIVGSAVLLLICFALMIHEPAGEGVANLLSWRARPDEPLS